MIEKAEKSEKKKTDTHSHTNYLWAIYDLFIYYIYIWETLRATKSFWKKVNNYINVNIKLLNLDIFCFYFYLQDEKHWRWNKKKKKKYSKLKGRKRFLLQIAIQDENYWSGFVSSSTHVFFYFTFTYVDWIEGKGNFFKIR